MSSEAFIIQWDGHSKIVRKVATAFEMPPGTILDCAYFEPFGGVYVGNYVSPQFCMGPSTLNLCGYFGNSNILEYANDFGSTSGAVIIPEQRTNYHLDGCNKQLHAFTWDPWTVVICANIRSELIISSTIMRTM